MKVSKSFLALAMALAACRSEDTARTADEDTADIIGADAPNAEGGSDADDAATAGTDGLYTCESDQSSGGSCDQPLFDPGIQAAWTLSLLGSALTIESIGFDAPEITCVGQWTDARFDCDTSWWRAGRLCALSLRVRLESNATLTFWLGTLDNQTATCQRS